YATAQLRVLRSAVYRETAFQIAEAGINYYQWHLANFVTDFYDGNASSTSPGPYLHDFYDQDTNQLIGRYSLQITPPVGGSRTVTVQSTGYTLANPSTKRVITVVYNIATVANYAFLTNSSV